MLETFTVDRLVVLHPSVTNAILLAVICLLAVIALRKTEPSVPLVPVQTNQVRGFIMLLIVLGHVWTHVSSSQPWPNFACASVATFLFLSGFGIVISYVKKKPQPLDFLKARLLRVMIPYWLTSALFFALDGALLGQFMGLPNAIMTIFGINLNEPTRLFDYVRWYITFQIFWYFLFIIAFSTIRPKLAAVVLLGISPILLILDYYVLHVGWSKYVAFPAGCFVGLHKDAIVAYCQKATTWLLLLVPLILGLFLAIKWSIYSGQCAWLPSIVREGVLEMNSLLWTAFFLMFMAVLGRFGLQSRFLVFMGTISYELFLLHGPFLVKYNPFFSCRQNMVCRFRSLSFAWACSW